MTPIAHASHSIPYPCPVSLAANTCGSSKIKDALQRASQELLEEEAQMIPCSYKSAARATDLWSNVESGAAGGEHGLLL